MDALKKVTLDDAKKFYADFYGASNAEVVVIGDFDPAEVQKLVDRAVRRLEESQALQSHHARLAEADARGSLHRNAR